MMTWATRSFVGFACLCQVKRVITLFLAQRFHTSIFSLCTPRFFAARFYFVIFNITASAWEIKGVRFPLFLRQLSYRTVVRAINSFQCTKQCSNSIILPQFSSCWFEKSAYIPPVLNSFFALLSTFQLMSLFSISYRFRMKFSYQPSPRYSYILLCRLSFSSFVSPLSAECVPILNCTN